MHEPDRRGTHGRPVARRVKPGPDPVPRLAPLELADGSAGRPPDTAAGREPAHEPGHEVVGIEPAPGRDQAFADERRELSVVAPAGTTGGKVDGSDCSPELPQSEFGTGEFSSQNHEMGLGSPVPSELASEPGEQGR